MPILAERGDRATIDPVRRAKGMAPRRLGQLAVKRAIDMAGAAIGLAVCGAVYLWYAPRLRRESPGPVFYSHQRTGLNGQPFRCYKFRTMVVDAERQEEELALDSKFGAAYFKHPNDPRIIPSGRWMRRHYLDELPQFWNVLRGEMSLVGPRPSTVTETVYYADRQRRRLAMKPGMTGLFQVDGHDAVEDLDSLMEIDCAYIDNWSVWLDLKLLLKTLPKVVRADGL
jgi:lipopolysaccharide/colanic/teichoic acid biosynthesis glycosyltransferase